MSLEEILTNRTRLSEDILREVQEAAAAYGVAIFRADVKDLIFPGNLQEIMNRVLAAERLSQAQLVEARTKAETQHMAAEASAAAQLVTAQADAEAVRLKTEADVQALREREAAASAYSDHPALLRLRELDTLRELAQTASARLYIGFDKHVERNGALPESGGAG